MSELWLPQSGNTPDVTNLYDMMLVFQEEVDSKEKREDKIVTASFAVRTLAKSLKELDEDQKQISLTTEFAILDSTEGKRSGIIARRVGMRGMLDDIHGVSLGKTLPLALTLGIDVVSIFPINEPDDVDYVMTNAKAPINKVHYIETHAA